MPSLWQVRRAEPERAAALAEAAGLDPLTAQLLLHRGIHEPLAAASFLHPRLDSLGDPSALPDLARGLARIHRAIEQRESILIFGDSDVDGLTASVILSEVLAALGAVVRVQSSNRLRDGYGLPASLVRQLERSSTQLVILVDCGTNQADAIRELSDAGIEAIVIDHHVPLEGWAQPCALINPHRTDSSGRPQAASVGAPVAHPSRLASLSEAAGVPGLGRELCSAGLALKVAQGLLGTQAPTFARYLDLAALGTLSDCVPLIGDNRIIVSEGLARIVQTHRPGLRRICEATHTTQADPEHIVRRLAPRLNASGRLGDPSAVRHLLRSDDSPDTEAWMAQTHEAHATTKRLYRQMMAEAERQVHRQHFRDQFIMVVTQTGWHQGLTGVLASQLAARYGRPAIAIALDEHRGIGSGRSIPRFNLLNALKACQPWLVRFGGHAQACGLTVDRQHVERFRGLVNEHGRILLGREGLVPIRVIDLELPLEAVQPRWVKETESFAPFGRGNERPTVVIRRVRIDQVSPRVATLSDGKQCLEARGVWTGVSAEEDYDVVATPSVVKGDVRLTVSDVKASAAL